MYTFTFAECILDRVLDSVNKKMKKKDGRGFAVVRSGFPANRFAEYAANMSLYWPAGPHRTTRLPMTSSFWAGGGLHADG